MPFIVPIVAAVASALPAISAGLGIATTIGGLVGGGGGQSGPTAEEMAKAQAAQQSQQDQQNKTNAIQAARQYVPNIQAQLGGAVSPEYYAQTAATQTGWGDQLGAVRQALAMQGLAPSATTQGLSANGTNPIPAAFNNTGDMSSILASLTGQGGQQFHGA